MPETIIKICGLTREQDGLAAIDFGADWLGFIRVRQTPRFRPIEQCARVLERIRVNASRPFQAVGVYVDAPVDLIRSEARRAGFDRVQLHGEETLEFARSLLIPLTKTIKISDAGSIARADDYPGLDLLTDTADPHLQGGTGRGYDVDLLADLTRRRRVMIAGGLHPSNVGAVVRRLGPWGVDVSSAVESAPGIKDPEKIEAFITAVRRASSRD